MKHTRLFMLLFTLFSSQVFAHQWDFGTSNCQYNQGQVIHGEFKLDFLYSEKSESVAIKISKKLMDENQDGQPSRTAQYTVTLDNSEDIYTCERTIGQHVCVEISCFLKSNQ